MVIVMQTKKGLNMDSPVTVKSLLVTVGSFSGAVIFLIILGWIFGSYNELRVIPVSDIKKAVEYSVYEQQDRKQYYMDILKKLEFTDARHNDRISHIEDQLDDLKELKEKVTKLSFAVESLTKELQRLELIDGVPNKTSQYGR